MVLLNADFWVCHFSRELFWRSVYRDDLINNKAASQNGINKYLPMDIQLLEGDSIIILLVLENFSWLRVMMAIYLLAAHFWAWY